MVDRKNQMDELQSGPIMVKALMGRHFVKSKWLAPTMWLGNPIFFRNNVMNINEFAGETILYG
jgi:hypothetical protein